MERYLWGGIFSDVQKSSRIKRFIDSFGFDRVMSRENFDVTLTHALALSKIGLIKREDLRRMFESKDKILKLVSEAKDDEFEDVHSSLEFFISQEIGKDVGFNLRLGRSRNEEVITTTYLWILRNSYYMMDILSKVSESILACAKDNLGKVIPLLTHTRQAQPILFSHLVLSYHEGFIRCAERFRDCLRRFDVCHLGSGAGAGVNLPLDVELMADVLGFSRVSQNSIDSTGRRDNISELIFTFYTFSELFSRAATDLILLSSENYGFVEISDKICTGSSMMPQKKNPDALELLRAKSAKFIGYLNSVLSLEKGLHSGYSKDLQEDKRILFPAFYEILELLEIVPEIFSNIRAADGKPLEHTLATDLADELVLSQRMTYREAHRVVGEKLKRGEKIEGIAFEKSVELKKTPQSTNPKIVEYQSQNHKTRISEVLEETRRLLERFQEKKFEERFLRNI